MLNSSPNHVLFHDSSKGTLAPQLSARKESSDADVWRTRFILLLMVVVAGLIVALIVVVEGHSDNNNTGGLTLTDGQSLYAVYDTFLKRSKYIDLTHEMSPSTPVWPGFGKMTVEAGMTGQEIPGYASIGDEWSYYTHGFVATQYMIPTDQYGTQLDPPGHWNEYGATISDLPATYAIRPLVVVNVADKVALDAAYSATAQDVLDWEEAHGRVPEGSVVFFRSDYSTRWQEYIDAGTTPALLPGVSLGALQFLHNERGILFHGHEPLDTDMTPNLEGEAWLLHNNYCQAEGVANLDQVPESGCLVTIGFSKTQGGTGGYARYIAICPPNTDEGVSIAEAPGAPLPTHDAPLRRDARGVMVPTPGATPTDYCVSPISLGCVNGTLVN